MNTENNANRSTVLVLGANGRLGQSACESFAQAGWRVLAHTRRELHWHQANADKSIQVVSGDFGKLGKHDPAFDRISVIVNALNPIYTRWQSEALPLARQTMDLAQRLGATLMFPGNVYNFGASMPPLLNEDTPENAMTRKGRIRIEIEAELRARAEQGLRTIIVRAGDFFGAGSGSWFDLVITKHLKKGRLTYPGNRDLVHAWAYLPDLTRYIVALAERRRHLAKFEVFHFDGHAITGNELIAGIETAAKSVGLLESGQRVSVHKLPWTIMKLAALFSPMMRELVEMKYLWDVPHQLVGRRLGQLPGLTSVDTFQTPLAAALLHSLRLQAGMSVAQSVNADADAAGMVVAIGRR